MGAWGRRTFDNDGAQDWLIELVELDHVSLFEAALFRVCDTQFGGHNDSIDCERALAAAEIVAAGLGAPDPSLPPDAVAWLERTEVRFSHRLGMLARRAVDQVLTDSELKDLWGDTEYAGEWHNIIYQLAARLASRT